MATFYVLPSRQLLGQRFGALLAALFPGVSYTVWDWPDLAKALAAEVEAQGNTFVVYREDLDDELSVPEALRQHFGAEPNDAIIESASGAELHQRWLAEDVRKTA